MGGTVFPALLLVPTQEVSLRHWLFENAMLTW
jgi:hypothetical protein